MPLRIFAQLRKQLAIQAWRRKARKKSTARLMITDVPGFLQKLEQRGIRSVVLRWPDEVPQSASAEKVCTEDVDLLIDGNGLDCAIEIAAGQPGKIKCDLYTSTGHRGTTYRKMPYYPPVLADRILSHRECYNSSFHIPDPLTHFCSLAFHLVYHKGLESGIPSGCHLETSPAPKRDYGKLLEGLACAAGIPLEAPTSLFQLHQLLKKHDWEMPPDLLVRWPKQTDWHRWLLKQQNARDELEQVKVEFAAADEAHEKEAQKLQQDKKFLVDANDRLREKLDEATNVSFEQPDGVIRTVDNTTGLVWINRGSADSLSKRITFSVYTKGHHGVARGGEDIKGAIEVTRIIGAHLAEARILSDDIFAPITPGDPIYTPLWSPGRKQIFSFAGLMDLDQDKVSDRKLLRELVAAAGAEIDNEIDDEGNRTGDGITINTKFLVIGEMPDPSEEVNLDEKARMSKILEEFKRLREEARRQGVRVVNLNDFLSFIGYKPQRRTWVPGMKIPWNLSAGAHSASLKSKVGDRSSSGQVSGAYTRSKRLLQQKSSGQTSRLFRGGAKGGY